MGADSNLLLPHPVQFCTFSASPIPICIATNPLCYLLLGPKICNNEEGSRNSLTEMQDEKWSGHFGGGIYEVVPLSVRPSVLLRSLALHLYSILQLNWTRGAGHAVEDSNYNWIGLIKRPFDDAHKSACAPVPGFEQDIPNQRSNFAYAVKVEY